MTHEETTQPPVTLSESAADVLKTVAANAETGSDQTMIRFSVQQQNEEVSHHIALEAAPAETDVVFEQHGVTLVVAEEQVPFVNGSHIEYTATGDQPQLLVSNPNLGTA